MSKPMTTHERIKRMFEHRDADCIPICDSPWSATIERWQREGLPADVPYEEYLGMDRQANIWPDTSPRYPVKTLEETDDYRVYTSAWGVTMKQWKHEASTPQFLDFTVIDPDTWRAAKARMTPSRDRIDWKQLGLDYAGWRKAGLWVNANFWFGFDITHSWFVGTERILMAIAENPEWCKEMFEHELEMSIALFDMIWEAGYHIDGVVWPDDMGYKYNQFFSLATYRDLLKPLHRRVVEWAHAKGLKVLLHSCGDVRPFVPDLIEIGIDGLNPVEVKAGMDPVALKRQYGDKLLFHGGVNALLYNEPGKFEDEMRRVIPILKQGGGYIFGSDHSIPSAVSLERFKAIVKLARELGRY